MIPEKILIQSVLLIRQIYSTYYDYILIFTAVARCSLYLGDKEKSAFNRLGLRLINTIVYRMWIFSSNELFDILSYNL